MTDFDEKFRKIKNEPLNRGSCPSWTRKIGIDRIAVRWGKKEAKILSRIDLTKILARELATPFFAKLEYKNPPPPSLKSV